MIAATVHAYPSVKPFDMRQYQPRLDEANAYCVQNGWQLRVVEGSEIRYCSTVPDQLTAGRLPTLGGTRSVLIEFSQEVDFPEIEKASDRLYREGYLPVVAHVERYSNLVRSVRRALLLRSEYGLLFQMNCSTILHPSGIIRSHFVRTLLNEEAVDLMATDAHDVRRRPVRMRAAYDRICALYGKQYACRLVSRSWNMLKQRKA